MPQSPSRILLVSASEMEMVDHSNSSINSIVTGIGMVSTTYALTKLLALDKYDLVINLGIAGAFKSEHRIGTVVQVSSDRLVELGVEDNGRFIPADEMNLVAKKEMYFTSDHQIDGLPKVDGITVNRVHGSSDSIQKVKDQFNPDVESMEGAAVAYVCERFDVPWVQIRAISNMVEPRNRSAWDIPLAIKNLHFEVLNYLNSQHEA